MPTSAPKKPPPTVAEPTGLYVKLPVSPETAAAAQRLVETGVSFFDVARAFLDALHGASAAVERETKRLSGGRARGSARARRPRKRT